MNYPRLCKNCNEPFSGKNKFQVFCNPICGKEFYSKIKKMSKNEKSLEIDRTIREEWYMYETNPTKCYVCGAVIDYWTYDYAELYGRMCRECTDKRTIRKHKL